jgi:hypothetical protein
MQRAKQRIPDPEARHAILQAIDAADAPVTAVALGKRPGIGTGARVKLLLAEDVASGRVFDWGKAAYWHRNQETIARQRVLEVVDRECLSSSDLKKSVSRGAPKLTTQNGSIRHPEADLRETFVVQRNQSIECFWHN